MSESTVHGHCYCGAIHFEAELPTKFVAHCHCDNCRRAHGSGVVTWAGFLERQVRITEGEPHAGRYETETKATRTFCTRCGSPLFFQSPRWAGELHIAVAHFTDPLDADPKGHAFADEAPSWCPITDDLPR